MLNVQGSAEVTFADYGVAAPNAGLAKVDPSGQIEFLLTLGRAGTGVTPASS